MSNLITPFRYPGAKTRIASAILKPATDQVGEGWKFVDVFTGGGSVFIEAFNKMRVRDIVLNDLDDGISAFWCCISNNNYCRELIEMILKTIPTVEEHSRQRKKIEDGDVVEKGFASLFLNRTSFSGMLKSGPIGGYGQKSKYGVGCRYNAELIAEKVRALGENLTGKIDVFNDDFEKVIDGFDRENTIIYCDSPYYVKGNQLYRHKMDDADHRRLRSKILALKRAKFLMSYDNSPNVRKMYGGLATIEEIPVRYSIKGQDRESWGKNTELLIHNF